MGGRLFTDKLVCGRLKVLGVWTLDSATPFPSTYPAHASGSPRDPIKDGRNWYGYCENNPVNTIDAAGLSGDLIVKGDVAGVPLADTGYYLDKPIPYKTRGDKEMITPSKAALREAMIECEGDFYYYGHGTQAGSLNINKDERLTQADLAYIAKEKKRRGKKKMKSATLRACHQGEKGEFVNAWLQISEQVTAVCGLTAEKQFPYRLAPTQTYRSPQKPGPITAPGIRGDGKDKRGGS